MANNIGDFRGSLPDGLRITGAVEDPRINGLLRIDGGTLRYKGKDFQLEPSTAEFRGERAWYPWIELSMWTDVATRADSYRISYYVSGFLNRLRFTASSDPFLAEKDINSLLLFGLTEEQLAAGNVVGLGGRTTGSVGRVKVRFLRDLYLEGSWVRDDAATTDFGNFSLDLKLELNFD